VVFDFSKIQACIEFRAVPAASNIFQCKCGRLEFFGQFIAGEDIQDIPDLPFFHFRVRYDRKIDLLQVAQAGLVFQGIVISISFGHEPELLLMAE
jgi:hypothetical protein